MLNILNLSKKYKKYIFITIIVMLIITSIFIIKKTQKTNIIINELHHISLNSDNIYIHQGEDVNINIYNTNIEKNYRFKIITQNIKYLSDQNTIQLIHPNITIFDKKNIAIWKITSNHATVYHKQKILHLHGCIHINNLLKNTNLSSVITNQAIINLITNDIVSNTKVILHGNYFYSIGTQMHGNLYTKTIKLINNTYTCYEIQHIEHNSKNIYFN